MDKDLILLYCENINRLDFLIHSRIIGYKKELGPWVEGFFIFNIYLALLGCYQTVDTILCQKESQCESH